MHKVQKVLILDENPKKLIEVERKLSFFAHVEVVCNGAEALILWQSFNPDLVIINMGVEGINGHELCRQFSSSYTNSLSSILLIADNVSPEERLNFYGSGAHDYILRPFLPEEIVRKAKILLKKNAIQAKLCDLNVNLEEKVNNCYEQLFKVKKAALIGAHVAETIHNLNNYLAIADGFINLLEMKYPDEEGIKKSLCALEKIADLSRTILKSSRISNDQEMKSCDLNRILELELHLIESQKSTSAAITFESKLGAIPLIEGVPSHFSQIFSNLIKNAIDSMYTSASKKLSITSREEHDGVVLEIRDTGCGIPATNLEKIFDPFFTTKPIETNSNEPIGTGVGLSSVKRILESYGGSLSLDSTVGKGTLVSLRFPLPRERSFDFDKSLAYKRAPIPKDEIQRLEALKDYELLEEINHQVFHHLVFLATTICQTEMGAISLVGSDKQHLKARVGFPAHIKESSRESSFCGHAIMERKAFIVEDTHKDDRFKGNPLVIGEPFIRFYASIPLIASGKQAIGTLCVIDKKARGISLRQLTCLEAIAKQIENQFEWNKNILLMMRTEKQTILEKKSLDVADELNDKINQSITNLGKIKQDIQRGWEKIQSLTPEISSIGKYAPVIMEDIKEMNLEFSEILHKK
jgi:signal transduction histidine kinase